MMLLGALTSTDLSHRNGLFLFQTGWYGAKIVLKLGIPLPKLEAI